MSDPIELEQLRQFSDGTEDGCRTLVLLLLAETEDTAVSLARMPKQILAAVRTSIEAAS